MHLQQKQPMKLSIECWMHTRAFIRKHLKHFRTLHSLAFNRLGMRKSEVIQDEHYEDIGRKLGIEVTVYSNGQETTGFVDSNSEYFNLINAARIKEITIQEEYKYRHVFL